MLTLNWARSRWRQARRVSFDISVASGKDSSGELGGEVTREEGQEELLALAGDTDSPRDEPTTAWLRCAPRPVHNLK